MEKSKRIINFWRRFNLSLFGRLRVTKTYLLSQLGYKSTALNFDNDKFKDLDLLWANFIRGNDKISNEKIFGAKSGGGLALPRSMEYSLSCPKGNDIGELFFKLHRG